jgi:hypothetical protein
LTLIVSAVVGDWAFHASDRLISIDPPPPGNPTGEFDPHSNKTVVVIGTDSWVVLGYTGIAFLDGKPTDQGRVTTVMFSIRAQNDSATSAERGPDIQSFSQGQVHAVGMVNMEIIRRAKARVSAIGGSRDEIPDRVREILIDAVLETSAITDAVGDNVMTVVLDQPASTIRTGLYITDRQRQADLFETARKQSPGESDQFAERLTVSTPYVLLPDAIWSPSIGTPSAWIGDNGITFDYKGFDSQPGSGGGMFFGAQPRRDWP